jgi:5-methylthioadenosine/S-adenosylhomocysteine deaminase
LATYLDEHIRVALGTDGASSNNTLDMFQEIRLAAMLAAASTGDAGKVSPFDILSMATIGGATALGRDSECGTLEVGKDADLMLLSTDSLHMTPLNNIFSALVFSAKSSDVQTVFCSGELLMENRKILVLDEHQVIQEFNDRWEQIQHRSS